MTDNSLSHGELTPLLSNSEHAIQVRGRNDGTAAPSSCLPERPSRVIAYDILRGIIIVLMSIDHARMYLAGVDMGGSELWNNSPHYQNSVYIFLIRFITALCAPGFFFLMGVSANFLYNARKSIWTKRRILRYFFIRGGLLVFLCHLNYMLLNHSERFSFGLTVLFALGIDLILCGITVTLFDHFCSPRKREALGIGCLVCTLIILYCLTEYVIAYARHFPPTTEFNFFLRLTILPGPIGSLESLYAFLPWYIPALWGIIYSKTFNTTSSIRGFVINMIIGLSFIVIYIPLHEFNIGTLFPPQSSLSEFEISSVHPVIELLYNTKYPPSLTFLLLNLGLTHIILSVCFLIDCPCSSPNSTEERDDSGTEDSDDNYSKSIWNSCKYILKIPLVLGSMIGSKFILPIFYTLGKSALFFYMLHLVGYRVLSILVNWKLQAEHDNKVGENLKIGVGINETFWLLWALGMMIFWPCCRIFERFKHSRPVDSVWRFF